MKILYITGVIGSGKSTLDRLLRQQLDVYHDTSKVPYNKGVCFIGEMYGKNNQKINFGGADKYKGGTEIITEELENQKKLGREYAVVSGILGKKKLINYAVCGNNELYAAFNRKGPITIKKYRERRRNPKRKYDPVKEMIGIKKGIRLLELQISKWEKDEIKYPNIHVIAFKKSERTRERVKTLLSILNKPMKYHRLKREFK
jgi:hypothetical protein